jgi:hypothetical protein
MRKVVLLTVAAIIGAASSASGQGDLEQKLKEQFTITEITADRSDITSAGTVVTLRKGGLFTYSTASPVPYLNTYNKKGKISQPFMANLGAGVAGGLASNNTNYPQHLFLGGEKFSIIGMSVKDGVTFRLYSDPYNGLRYYGDLKFPFEKGSIPAPDEFLARIAEVLAVSSAPTQAADKGDTPPPPSPPPHEPLHLPATYVSAQTPTDQLQLYANNSLSLNAGGQTSRGTFMQNGNILRVTIPDTNVETTMTIQDSSLTDASGQIWTLQKQVAPPEPSGPALRNEDIIKLAKVGIDDATILAKIENSKCQFDTSPDALIQLKQSGVSAAVLKAMVGAVISPVRAPTAASGAAAPVLPSGVPTPLTPADGSIFDNFPRKTTVSWTAVSGAVEYRVEVDFSFSGVWASENPDRPTPPHTYSSKTTSFSFNFVGAQPGRWRVSAIDREGHRSEPSPWWSFRYTR